jgi:hypothetical protein
MYETQIRAIIRTKGKNAFFRAELLEGATIRTDECDNYSHIDFEAWGHSFSLTMDELEAKTV